MPASASIVRTISIKRHDHASQRQHCGCSIGNAAQATPVESGTGPLAELVAYTASQAPRDGTGGTLNDAAWRRAFRSEEHTSELQSLMRISYAVFCLKKKRIQN